MTKATDHATSALILPGIDDSGTGHWQTLWEQADPFFTRVRQRDWAHPLRAEWQAQLDAAVRAASGPVVLVAHSLGCLLTAHWALAPGADTRRVRGALLVAPPDPDGANFPADTSGFAPVPRRRLPFPVIVVASSDDPYGSLAFAATHAAAWGGRLLNLGAKGHINADSGLGDWAEGRALVRELGSAPGAA